jgi:hypothetical protein
MCNPLGLCPVFVSFKAVCGHAAKLEELAHLTLEHLRAIRSDVAALKTGQDTMRSDLLSLRKEVNGLRGELLRFEENLAAIGVQIERIGARLGLNETPQ